MKQIKRSYTTIRRKYRTSSGNKSADLFEKTKAGKSSNERFSVHSPLKKCKRKKGSFRRKVSETADNNLTTSSLKYFFSPVEALQSDRERDLLKMYSSGTESGITEASIGSLDMAKTRFIALDSFDDYDEKRKFPSNRGENVQRSTPKKISTKRKGNVKKRPTLTKPSLLSSKTATTAKTKKLENEGDKSSKTRNTSKTFSDQIIKEKQLFRQQAAGDGEKREKKHDAEEKENVATWQGDREELDENDENNVVTHQRLSSFDKISRTFLDICLPFTYTRPKSPEEEITKIDKNFIRSLMRIAKSRENIQAEKAKNQNDGNKRGKNQKNHENTKPKKSSNTKAEKKPKKQLHQTQNVFFIPEIKKNLLTEKPFYELKDGTGADKTKTSKNLKQQSLTNKKSKARGVQLAQIKSETKTKSNRTKTEEKNRKTLSKSSKRKQASGIEIPFNDDGMKITEIWRNETRVASDNSITSQSTVSSTQGDMKDINFPPDLEMKSYQTLRKIVEEEVKRICKSRQENDIKNDAETPVADVTEDDTEKKDKSKPPMAEDFITQTKELIKSKSVINEVTQKESNIVGEDVSQKITIPNTQNLYEMFYTEEGIEEKDSSLYSVENNQKQEKLNALKKKLNILAQETNDNGKIPGEIIKNWSIIRRLEKAFLALGTPPFPNKNLKNSVGDISQPNQSIRKSNLPRIRRSKNYSETPNKNMAAKHESFNRPQSSQQPVKIEDCKRIEPNDDMGKSEIYFFSFEPLSPGPRKKSNKGSLQDKINVDYDPTKMAIEEDTLFNSKKRPPNDETTNVSEVKDPQNAMNWLKLMNGEEQDWTVPSHPIEEDKMPKKPEKRPSKKHSTHTIYISGKNIKPPTLTKQSSSTTFIIDSEQETSGTMLERKDTFDVIPSKKPDIKSKSYTKVNLASGRNDVKKDSSEVKATKSRHTIDKDTPRKQVQVSNQKSNLPKRVATNSEKIKKMEPYEGVKLASDMRQRTLMKQREKQTKTIEATPEKFLRTENTHVLLTPNVTIERDNKPFITLESPKKPMMVTTSTSAIAIETVAKPVETIIQNKLQPDASSANQSYNSSISTNTYYVTDGGDRNTKMTPLAKQISSNVSSLQSKGSTSALENPRMQGVPKKKGDKCSWEQDIKQYRQIVRDIMSQYQRTNGFLKQSERISEVREDSTTSITEEEGLIGSHFANIAEYRKRIMHEYNTVPLIEYKSKFLEEKNCKSTSKKAFPERNLVVAKNVSEDVDSDVKDYYPKIHQILDSQVYVDTKNIGKRQKINRNTTDKVTSLQETLRIDETENLVKKGYTSQSVRVVGRPEYSIKKPFDTKPNMINAKSDSFGGMINSQTSFSDCESIE